MPATRGKFTEGKNKGKRWEIYQDDRSSTGWVRKIWLPGDASNGGRPVESFENYDYESDLEDEQAATGASERKRAEQAALRAEIKADQAAAEAASDARNTPYWNSQLAYRDTRDTESDRRFNVGEERAERSRKDRIDEVRKALKQQKYEFERTNAIAERRAAVDEGGLQLRGQELGADILKTGAGMRGALQWAQGDAYAQGVSGSGLSPFVAALRGGTPVAYGGATATQGNPIPLTVGTLSNVLTGQSAGGFDAFGRPRLSPDVQAGVDAASGIYQKGLANAPQGFFSNMTAGQRDAFRSAGAWLGRDVESEDQYLERSRPKQRSALLG